MKCYAKVNPGLDVKEKRSDGYHEVELIFDSISLFDLLHISLIGCGIELTCTDPTLPTDRENIAYRAAEAVMDYLKLSADDVGVKIDIDKKIPHGAGLGGGSADAAGVIIGLSMLLLYKDYITKPLTVEEMISMAVKLGADVPFCIIGGTAFARGIGEKMQPLPKLDFNYVIVKPQESVSTAYVYKSLDSPEAARNRVRCGELSIPAAVSALRRNDIEAYVKHTGNIMETVTANDFPVIDKIKNLLNKNGAIVSMMSGSGTSVFGAFACMDEAEAAASRIPRELGEVYVCPCRK